MVGYGELCYRWVVGIMRVMERNFLSESLICLFFEVVLRLRKFRVILGEVEEGKGNLMRGIF